jgi:hypothetical protein
MYCSGSESSELEHFRPKTSFPHDAMSWENFIWSCGICNNFKGTLFPDADNGGPIINPLSEHAWEFFFIDEFGNLCPRWKIDLQCLDTRACKTIEVVRLDREALQVARLARLVELRRSINDSLALYNAGELTVADLCTRRDDWCTAPLHPDVADYFLAGPGAKESPFSDFLKILNG